MSAAKTVMSPEQILEDAERDIREAAALEETLEERVREGDETIDAEQLDKARGLRRFAELRRAAAEKKAAALSEKLEADRIEAVLDEHLAGAGNVDAEIAAHLDEAWTHVEKALAVQKAHDWHVYSIAAAASSKGNPYDSENDPVIVGDAQVLSIAWFKARGVKGTMINKSGVRDLLVARFGS